MSPQTPDVRDMPFAVFVLLSAEQDCQIKSRDIIKRTQKFVLQMLNIQRLVNPRHTLLSRRPQRLRGLKTYPYPAISAGNRCHSSGQGGVESGPDCSYPLVPRRGRPAGAVRKYQALQFTFDNDLFANRDQDYSNGFCPHGRHPTCAASQTMIACRLYCNRRANCSLRCTAHRRSG